MANIHTRSKSGFILRSGVRRRETAWFAGNYLTTSVAAANTAILLTSLNAAALALRPFTVIRTRGQVCIRTDQLAASETQFGGYGMAVVSDQASAIGITAVPTPVTDDGSDLWYLYQSLMAEIRFGDATGFADMSRCYQVDSRAMRKVEDGQDVIEVVESAGIGAGWVLSSYQRTLIKLH